ncbi:MAG: S8 family serine peptidase [Saprospiraceae bacterium]|nr:S8 family serine peptidase [Saprospiraceae bacterium]
MKQFFKVLGLMTILHNFMIGQILHKEFIIDYRGKDISEMISRIAKVSERNSQSDIHSVEKIAINFDIYKIRITEESAFFWYDELKKQSDVFGIELNAELELRKRPNDPRVEEQWYLNTIQAFEAWNITTGGKDFGGQDIVIAVLDDGYVLQHEDLKDNMWNNNFEIPDDGIDNDLNGFVDDFAGWNTKSKDDITENRSHGTNVLGVLAARGDNNLGIAGLNWNVKIMPVTIGNNVSDIIAAFDYIFTQRKRFNTSGGSSGAFVVATSYSGGLPDAFAKDFPVWCNMYDKLGQEGIISIGATPNEDQNIDIKGDMPSTCESNYLIVVTSTDKNDEKEPEAGYSLKNVDIAAPGERILTTDMVSKGLYKTESGTSLSTPMIAATVGLLYAAGCEPFYNFVKNNTSLAPLVVKDMILTTVDKKTSLADKTVSGGRLNMYKAILDLQNRFDNCLLLPSLKGPLKVETVSYNNGILSVGYLSPDENPLELNIYDLAGKSIRKHEFTPAEFGDKIISIPLNIQPNFMYFISIRSGKTFASKGWMPLKQYIE